MTTKKNTQFSLEDCSCMDMMSKFRDQKEIVDPCAEMMSQFTGRQEAGDELSVMMSQMIASCCGFQEESDKTTKKA